MTDDIRPLWPRVLVGIGILLMLIIGLPMLVLGFVLLEEDEGPFLLSFGLLLTALSVGGVAREASERRFRRDPPRPRLQPLPPAESALFLPRASGPSMVSAWSLAALGAVCLLGAGFAAAATRWGLAGLLVLAGLGCLAVAQPHRARSQAGGLWFSPSHIRHVHDGVEWEIPWADVHGAVPRGPFLAVLVHQGRLPDIRRTWVAGRHRGRAVIAGVLAVDTHSLAGDSVLASYVIEKALADPRFRAALGTPESLPPPRS